MGGPTAAGADGSRVAAKMPGRTAMSKREKLSDEAIGAFLERHPGWERVSSHDGGHPHTPAPRGWPGSCGRSRSPTTPPASPSWSGWDSPPRRVTTTRTSTSAGAASRWPGRPTTPAASPRSTWRWPTARTRWRSTRGHPRPPALDPCPAIKTWRPRPGLRRTPRSSTRSRRPRSWSASASRGPCPTSTRRSPTRASPTSSAAAARTTSAWSSSETPCSACWWARS